MRFKPSKIVIFFSFLTLSCLIIFLNHYKILEKPKGFFNSIFSPVLKPAWEISGQFANIFSFAFNLKNTYSENSNLKNRNQELMAELSYLKDIARENNFLDKAKDLQMKENFDWQASRIIGMDMQNMAGYLIIDSGTDDGIRIDMPVITENKFLIGKIIEADKNFSKVITIFNPTTKIAIKTQDSEVFGLLNGNYTKKLTIDLISKDKELKIGESVVSSGKDGIYPAGLLIGQVEDFQIKPENLFQTAFTRGELDVYNLEKVLVLTRW